jgi:DNA-binding GntR family transcriptional regulator
VVNAYRIRAVLEALVVEQFIEQASELDVRMPTKDTEALKAAHRSGGTERMVIRKHSFFERICYGADTSIAFNIINRLVLRTASLRHLSITRKGRRAQCVD